MATLILLHGNTPDREIEIGERTLRLGRGDQNDVVLPDPGKSVSRFHAELRVEQGRFIVVDLNSQNGVWVGGRRVPQAALEPGVPVVLGTYQLILKPERLAQPDASDATVVTGTPPLGRQGTEIAPVPAPVPLAPPKPAAPAKPAPSVKPAAPAKPAAQAKPVKQAQPGSRGVLKWALIGGAAVLVLVAVIAGVMLAPVGGLRSEPAGAPPAEAPASAPAPAPSSTVTPIETPAASPVELPPVTPPVTTLPVPTPTVPPPPVQPRPEPQPVARPAAPPGATPAATLPRTQPAGRRGAATPAPEPKAKGPNLALAFEEARAAINRGDYPAAISGLESILSVDPSYPKAADMLEVARGSARNAASAAVAAGGKAEVDRDWAEAERQYERALQADPQSTQARDGLRRVKARMLSDGEDAFKRARQYDALGRVQEAISMYERAIQLLPPDHASLDDRTRAAGCSERRGGAMTTPSARGCGIVVVAALLSGTVAATPAPQRKAATWHRQGPIPGCRARPGCRSGPSGVRTRRFRSSSRRRTGWCCRRAARWSSRQPVGRATPSCSSSDRRCVRRSSPRTSPTCSRRSRSTRSRSASRRPPTSSRRSSIRATRRLVAVQYSRPGVLGSERVRQYSVPVGTELYRVTCISSAAQIRRLRPGVLAHCGVR